MRILNNTVLVRPIQTGSTIIILVRPETGIVVAVGDKCTKAKVGDTVILTENNFDVAIELNGENHLFINEKDILIKQ